MVGFANFIFFRRFQIVNESSQVVAEYSGNPTEVWNSIIAGALKFTPVFKGDPSLGHLVVPLLQNVKIIGQQSLNGARIMALMSSKKWFELLNEPRFYDYTTDPSSEYMFLVQAHPALVNTRRLLQAYTRGNIIKLDLQTPSQELASRITENSLNELDTIVCKLSQYSDTLILGGKVSDPTLAVLEGLSKADLSQSFFLSMTLPSGATITNNKIIAIETISQSMTLLVYFDAIVAVNIGSSMSLLGFV